jgi:hypothetical protein
LRSKRRQIPIAIYALLSLGDNTVSEPQHFAEDDLVTVLDLVSPLAVTGQEVDGFQFLLAGTADACKVNGEGRALELNGPEPVRRSVDEMKLSAIQCHPVAFQRIKRGE